VNEAGRPRASRSTSHPAPPATDAPLFVACVAVMVGGLAVSAWQPREWSTWSMEVAPTFIVVPLLLATRARFPLTPLAGVLIALHSLVLATGGHYTYAEVPLGRWVQQWLELPRNDFDRLGHFAQGFVPAIIVRELLLRHTPLPRGGWLFTLVTATCLAVSACYEFIEWGAALALGQGADAFLGTQGDPWDTQWDMFTAFIGALVAQLLLSRVHDAQLARRGLAQAGRAPAAQGQPVAS
jgi:putative membrane protein